MNYDPRLEELHARRLKTKSELSRLERLIAGQIQCPECGSGEVSDEYVFTSPGHPDGYRCTPCGNFWFAR